VGSPDCLGNKEVFHDCETCLNCDVFPKCLTLLVDALLKELAAYFSFHKSVASDKLSTLALQINR
jgi:hypothetical protein